MTDFIFNFRVSSCLFCSLLLGGCQSIPVEPSGPCNTSSCRTCSGDCETLNVPIKPEKETNKPRTSNQIQTKLTPLLCNDASRFEHKVIGNGHCVSLIRLCSNAPTTNHWRAGEPVTKSSPVPGTVIATFAKGKYPNREGYHAAVFISQDHNGIWVWDQWQGKAVHKRLIRFGNKKTDPSNAAQAYSIVKLNQTKTPKPN